MPSTDIPELVRLIKITMSKPPHQDVFDLAIKPYWRVAMPRHMSPEDQIALTTGLGLVVGQYQFCGNTDNNGKTQVLKIHETPPEGYYDGEETQ